MTYKRKFATLMTVLVIAACGVLMPTRAQAWCDVTTIAGNYGFRLHEFVFDAGSGSVLLPAGTSLPGSFVGQIVFNSATGTVTGFHIGNRGGVPILSSTFNTPTDQSTYSVSSDCSGVLTLVLDDGSSRVYELSIVRGGAEIELAETSASSAVVSSGDAKRQPATCDATTIAGDFGVRFDRLLAPHGQNSGRPFDLGIFTPADSAGLFHFNPTTASPTVSGHLVGITGGTSSFSTTLIGGAYSVDSNCTGTVTFTDSEGVTKELAMAIVEDGSNIELEFANTTQPGAQIVGEGIGKKQ